jgi:hypothetical protein
MIINDSGERPLLEERVEIVGNNGTVEERMEEFFENFEGYKKI